MFSKFNKSAFDVALDKNKPETLVMLQVGGGARRQCSVPRLYLRQRGVLLPVTDPSLFAEGRVGFGLSLCHPGGCRYQKGLVSHPAWSSCELPHLGGGFVAAFALVSSRCCREE